jgi:hypothetical protein
MQPKLQKLTWRRRRLQTDADRERVLDGLAAARGVAARAKTCAPAFND